MLVRWAVLAGRQHLVQVVILVGLPGVMWSKFRQISGRGGSSGFYPKATRMEEVGVADRAWVQPCNGRTAEEEMSSKSAVVEPVGRRRRIGKGKCARAPGQWERERGKGQCARYKGQGRAARGTKEEKRARGNGKSQRIGAMSKFQRVKGIFQGFRCKRN